MTAERDGESGQDLTARGVRADQVRGLAVDQAQQLADLAARELPRFASEITVSNNIAAVGGNASLLSLEND